MTKMNLLSVLLSFFLAFILYLIVIPILNKKKIYQPIYKYVSEHNDKRKTPIFGGVIFVLSSLIIFLIFNKVSDIITIVFISSLLAFSIIGFLDDIIKIKSRDNQGLYPYQKIIFQLFVSFFISYFSYKNGFTYFYIPFSKVKIDFGIWSIIINVLAILSTVNSVNLTDGLDGLASMTTLAFSIIFIVILFLEKNIFYDFSNFSLLSNYLITLIGSLIAFILFNFNKASIFMGECGSLSLGGFISLVCVFSGNTLYLPIIGIMFVLSSISVIIQVLYYKKTKKRVFLKTPIHHHFQLLGISEGKITILYFFITIIIGLFCIIFIL